jgi:hypothetical protein
MSIELIQTHEGHEVEYTTSRAFEKKRALVNRQWDVLLDGEKVGEIRYEMVSRERGPRQARYVTKRWSVPGWLYRHTAEAGRGIFSWSEATSRKQAIERIQWIEERRRREEQS